MKRWFDADKEHVAKRRSLEVHPAELSKTSLNPRPGGGGIGAALKGSQQLGYAGLRKLSKPPKRGTGRLSS